MIQFIVTEDVIKYYQLMLISRYRTYIIICITDTKMFKAIQATAVC